MITGDSIREWYTKQSRYVITFNDTTELYTAWDTKEKVRMNEFLSHSHAMAWLYANVHGQTLFLNKGVDCYV